MKERLPVNLENLELPEDQYKKLDKKNNTSYGYVNILSLISLVITTVTLLTILFFRK